MKNKKRSAFALSILIALLCSGCRFEESQSTKINLISVDIKMVTLEDGTKCAIFDAYKSGGISCDWK